MSLTKRNGSPFWWIGDTVKVKGKGKVRLRESTGQTDKQLAEEVRKQRLQEITQRLVHGIRREFTFSEGAAKLLKDAKGDTEDMIYHLDLLMPYLKDVPLSELYNQHPKLVEFREKRMEVVKNNTVNRSLEKVRRILNLAADEWMEDGQTWIQSARKIRLLPRDDQKGGYPLTWGQQRTFFALLPEHLRKMALFAVNTGVRDEQVVKLKWEWERRIPGVGMVFDLPTSKNGLPYRVPLNRIALEVIESCRGVHPVYVFARGHSCPVNCESPHKPVDTMNNTAWQNAREKAGLDNVRGEGAHFRVHDLRHTFSTRLREVGVSREDRKDLMGHKNDDITTHYSTAETAHLLSCVEKLVTMDEKPSVYLVAHS